jgi:hypothetical protein
MKTKFIIYEGPDEVLITTPESEDEMLAIYFFSLGGRDLKEWDRKEVTSEAVQINTTGMTVSW